MPRLRSVRDTFIAGVVFLLPLLILLVLLVKVFHFLTGFSKKMAALLGIDTVMGIPGEAIASTVIIVALVLFCGYLVRISLFKKFYDWLDGKMMNAIPGYKIYKELTVAKLNDKGPDLNAAYYKTGGLYLPCIVMEEGEGGRQTILFPSDGDLRGGIIASVPASDLVRLSPGEAHAFFDMLTKRGAGLEKLVKGR